MLSKMWGSLAIIGSTFVVSAVPVHGQTCGEPAESSYICSFAPPLLCPEGLMLTTWYSESCSHCCMACTPNGIEGGVTCNVGGGGGCDLPEGSCLIAQGECYPQIPACWVFVDIDGSAVTFPVGSTLTLNAAIIECIGQEDDVEWTICAGEELVDLTTDLEGESISMEILDFGMLVVSAHLPGEDALNGPYHLERHILVGSCAGDLDGDGDIDGADLGIVMGAWGPCVPSDCAADINRDGVVDGTDLGIVMGSWGSCP